MVSTAEGTIRERSELEGMLHDATGRLRPAHVAALVAHPEAICSALAAADALTEGDGERRSEVETITGPVLPTVDATETGRRLSARARARDGAPQRPLTWEELATRTGLKTRQTVHDWRRKSRIVGWQNARPGYVFPAEQLDGRNRPQPALDRVVELFANGCARVCVRSISSVGRLMRQVVNRLYTLQAKAEDLDILAMTERALAKARRWDEPELDDIILSAIASSHRRAAQGD